MKTYNVMLYPYRHESKQQAQKYVGMIKNGILSHPKEMTIAQIAKAMTSGHTVILGRAEYNPDDIPLILANQKGIGASIRHWKNQQIFAIDFDNEDRDKTRLTGNKYFSIDRAIAHCKAAKVPTAFCYTTGSHTEEHHKFRLIFVLDKVINTLEHHREIMNSLFNLFLVNGDCIVDIKCCDPCRLFYPGKGIVYKNYGAVVDTDKLIERYNSIASTARTIGVRTKQLAIKVDKVHFDAPKMIQMIKANDIKNILPEIVRRIRSPETLMNTESKTSGLHAEQVSYIYTKCISYLLYTVDSCSAKGPMPMKPVIVRLPEDYYAATRKFPLHILLGLPLNENFTCLLPSHLDTKPSARIEVNSEGDYIYHCYGCDSYLDIFGVLEHITGWSHMNSKAFVNKLMNLKFETEWQIQKKAEITEYQDYIWSDQFEITHEWLRRKLVHANVLGTLNLLLQMARLYIYDRKVTGNEDPLFYMSLSLMVQKGKAFGYQTMTKTSLHNKIKLLTRLELIIIVKEDELPDKFRAELQTRRAEKEQYYRINCFVIPEFSLPLLDQATARLREIEQSGMRRRYYCREAELRANDAESANRQYVQDENKTRSTKVEEFYIKYKDTAEKLMVKCWTTEKEILAKLKGFTTKRKQELSGICLPQLLKEMNLKQVSYSKQYETKFAIKRGLLSYGVNKIIVAEQVRRELGES